MFPEVTDKNDKSILREMVYGMLLYGVIGQLIVLLFSTSIRVSLGWWVGVLIAVVYGYQMWWSLGKALDLTEENARKKMTGYSTLRYLFIVAVMAVIMLTEIVNPLSAVFGIFALKAGAYLQPLMHLLRERMAKKKE